MPEEPEEKKMEIEPQMISEEASKAIVERYRVDGSTGLHLQEIYRATIPLLCAAEVPHVH